MRRRLRQRLRLMRVSDDRGSSLVLTIFYGAFALLLILLVVAATSLSLDRTRLFGIADGAALAGAEAFELSAVSTAGEGFTAVLQDADVQQAVLEHLAVVPHGTLGRARGRERRHAGRRLGRGDAERLVAAAGAHDVRAGRHPHRGDRDRALGAALARLVGALRRARHVAGDVAAERCRRR